MTRRVFQLLIGLVLYGVGISLMVQAAIGLDPWTVFAQGISIHTGIGIGWLSNIIGVFVLLLWIPLRQRPGVGTLLNILIIGPSLELGLWLIPQPEGFLWQALMFAAGLLMLAVASGLYIGAKFGPGPRDGLMTGLHARLGWPIWVARSVVEITVLATGWLLGGNVGIGTLAFALLVGPLCNWTLPMFDTRRKGTSKTSPALERELEGTATSSLVEPDSTQP